MDSEANPEHIDFRVEGLWKDIPPPQPIYPWELSFNDKKFLRSLKINPEG